MTFVPLNSKSTGGFVATGPVPTPQSNPVFAAEPSLADKIWNGLTGAASKVTDTLGLHNAVDATGTNIAAISAGAKGVVDLAKGKVPDPSLAYVEDPSLKKSIGAGAQFGATLAAGAAAPETIGGAIGAGALIGGSQTGGNSLASGDNLKTVAQKTTVGATVGAITSGAIAGFGKLLGAMGDKITSVNIKPTAADIKDGFSVDTINKYGLGGTLNQTYNKTQTKLSQLTDELNSKLADTQTSVNLQDVLQKTEEQLMGSSKAKTFGFNTKIGSAIEQIKNEVEQLGADVSVPEAQLAKQSAGKLGAWTYGKPDAESSAQEAVYTAFYNHLKKAIEDASPEGVKDINKQISQLIPIQTALIRRMPVAERNSALGLHDVITLTAGTMHPSAFGLTLLNRFAKSGAVGNALSNYISGAVKASAPLVAGGVGDVTSQLQSSAQGQ